MQQLGEGGLDRLGLLTLKESRRLGVRGWKVREAFLRGENVVFWKQPFHLICMHGLHTQLHLILHYLTSSPMTSIRSFHTSMLGGALVVP